MADVANDLPVINMLAAAKAQQLIAGAEERYDAALNEIVEVISGRPNIEIVLLAGPSSSGKTTTANKLTQKLLVAGHKAYTISLDDFYRNAVDAIVDDNGKADYETVNALQLDLLKAVLKNLVETRRSFIPRYDFDTGIRTDGAFEIILKPGDVVILEGLHALNPIIYGALPADALLKVYISVSTRIYDGQGNVWLTKRDLRLVRRTVRDYKFRSSSVENTFDMWDDVLDGEHKYLAPFKYCADMLIDSIHNYEPCVFKEEVTRLLSSVSPNSVWYSKAQRLCRLLAHFQPIPVSLVPENSLLREFLGNKM